MGYCCFGSVIISFINSFQKEFPGILSHISNSISTKPWGGLQKQTNPVYQTAHVLTSLINKDIF